MKNRCHLYCLDVFICICYTAFFRYDGGILETAKDVDVMAP